MPDRLGVEILAVAGFGIQHRVADQHLVGVQLGDLRIRQAQIVAQYRFVVLAQEVGLDVGAVGPTRELHRHPGQVEFADQAVLNPARGFALTQMRMIGRLVQRQHGSAWNAFLLQRRQRRVAGGELAEPVFQDLL